MWSGGPGRGRYRRFGCLFGFVRLAFVLVFVSFAIVVVSGLRSLAALLTGGTEGAGAPGIVAAASLVLLAVAAVAILVLGRTLGTIGGSLDDLVDATERLESGDYTARVPAPSRAPRGVRDLVRGFNTMATRLETDEAQRRSLLADVSHELRTPLSVVQGNLEAILDGVYPADRAHLEPLLDETRVLGRLVEDLRTVALAEAGTLALHREPTDLGILVADVAASFATAAAEADVELTSVSADLPLVDVDPVRIREVLGNLVSNALRHTPRGGRIEIKASSGGEWVAIRVHDSGAGIPPEFLAHVFERFAKGAESLGSGLGLAIARGLVEAHGGTIRVTSEAAAGTTFTIELPIGPAER
jgi:two-component system, OmpR family, sensor histidine kinase BaeS